MNTTKETNKITTPPPHKLTHLEGMRGLMALNVILCHFVCIFVPQMYFTAFADGTFLSRFADTPLSVLVNGDVAVTYFFALTGFLVARSQFIKETQISLLPNKMVSRYFKLLLVIAFATFFTYLTMVFGLQYHLSLTNNAINSNFLQGFCNFTPSIKSLFSNIFILPFVRTSAYIGPFWTISYEFWGYALIFLTSNILKTNRFRHLWYLLLAGILRITVQEIYLIFIFGLFVADLCYNNNENILNKFYNKFLNNKIFLIVCLIFATYFACVPINSCKLYFYWDYLPLGYRTLRGFGIALFIFASIKLEFVQKVLSFKPFVLLGEISFETYALHWPIMLSLQCGLFSIFISNGFSYTLSVSLSFLITLPVIYVASFLLHYLIKKINKLISVNKK